MEFPCHVSAMASGLRFIIVVEVYHTNPLLIRTLFSPSLVLLSPLITRVREENIFVDAAKNGGVWKRCVKSFPPHWWETYCA